MAVVDHRFRVMASAAQVLLVDAPDGAAAEAQRFLEGLERRWSRFLPDSDVARLNARPGRPVAVAPETLTLLAAMVDGWHASAGRYDPTVLPDLVAAGYAASREDPTRVTALPPGPARVGVLDEVVVDHEDGTATLPAGSAIDPGGIGKGLAADLTVAHLRAAGAAGALVSVGGDLAMAGRPPQPDGWYVAVEHADPTRGTLTTLAVSGGGVATSNVGAKRWHQADGGERHHVIDPTTRLPADTGLQAVTVVAPTGWEAEVHATAALLAGPDQVLAHLDGHGLSGLAITPSGAVLATDDLVRRAA